MPNDVLKARRPWTDKFARPTADDLLAGFREETRRLLDTARQGMVAGAELTEEITWQGVPWRWTFVYRAAREELPHAYLVPEPDRPQLALPLTDEMIESLPMRRVKKYIRDGILHARRVAGTSWPTWELTSMQQLTELLDLARRKHEAPAVAG